MHDLPHTRAPTPLMQQDLAHSVVCFGMGDEIRRVRAYRAKAIQDAFAFAGIMGIRLVVCDIEPGIVHWNEGDDVQTQRLRELSALLIAGSQVLLVTNSRRAAPRDLPAGQFMYVSRARKPWPRPWHVHLDLHDTPALVIGDLLITDGMLAWKHDLPFVLLSQPPHTPLWPRLLRLLGIFVRPLFSFRGNLDDC